MNVLNWFTPRENNTQESSVLLFPFTLCIKHGVLLFPFTLGTKACHEIGSGDTVDSERIALLMFTMK